MQVAFGRVRRRIALLPASFRFVVGKPLMVLLSDYRNILSNFIKPHLQGLGVLNWTKNGELNRPAGNSKLYYKSS